MIDPLIFEAELGEEARDFVKSQLGIFIIEQCKQDRQIALEKLADVDPEDLSATRNAINEVKLAERFEQKLVQIIQQGDSALAAWKQQEQQ